MFINICQRPTYEWFTVFSHVRKVKAFALVYTFCIYLSQSTRATKNCGRPKMLIGVCVSCLNSEHESLLLACRCSFKTQRHKGEAKKESSPARKSRCTENSFIPCLRSKPLFDINSLFEFNTFQHIRIVITYLVLVSLQSFITSIRTLEIPSKVLDSFTISQQEIYTSHINTMFHNTSTSHFSTSLRTQNIHSNILHNDENAQTKILRKKGLGNVNSRSTNENENNVSFKTPLAKGSGKETNHQSTSRRRALGDISNRKGYNESSNDGTSTRKGLGPSSISSKGGIDIYTSRKSVTVPKSTKKSEHKLKARDLNGNINHPIETNDVKKKSVSFAIHKSNVENNGTRVLEQTETAPVLNTSLLDDLDDIEICAGRTGDEERELLNKMGYFDDCNLSIDLDALDMIRRAEEERIQKNLEKRLQKIAITDEQMELEKKMMSDMQELEDEGIIPVFEDDIDSHFGVGFDDNLSLGGSNCDEQDFISGLDDISL